ncbi:MAG: FliM/FliN family flagellar motor switch protein [Rhodobacteraceae bacterium]|nr:FliM/FliN family flagellar motor switch protein [Paracoccaceae bacterium]
MADDRSQTVLKRKAEAGRPRTDLFAMTPKKALRQALAKAAQDLMEMPLSMSDWTETKMSLAELPETLEDRALLAILEGPGEGLGLIGISPPLLAGLLEKQTMGRLGTGEVPGRRPTRTDAALCAEFVDQALAGFGEFLAEEPDVTWAAGFRYASWLEDPRPLGLILEDTTYRVIRATVQLGTGEARTGQLLLCVPAKGRGPKPRPKLEPPEAAPEAAAGDADWSGLLEQTVMTADVLIDAVLYRVDMPIGEIMALQPGSELAIPMAALEQLELQGVDGKPLARGRLGQANGHRAVRMTVIDTAEAGPAAAPGPAGGAVASGGRQFEAGKPPVPAAAKARPAPSKPARDIPEPAPLSLDFGGVPDPAADPAPMAGLPPLGETGSLPPLGGDGGLPPLGDGGLPPLGDGGLPPLGEGGLPPLGDGGLPPLGGEDDGLPDLGAMPMKAANF